MSLPAVCLIVDAVDTIVHSCMVQMPYVAFSAICGARHLTGPTSGERRLVFAIGLSTRSPAKMASTGAGGWIGGNWMVL